jgi:hypothetical protein
MFHPRVPSLLTRLANIKPPLKSHARLMRLRRWLRFQKLKAQRESRDHPENSAW